MLHGMLDHLVLATPDVDSTSDWFAATTGVHPSVGGPHVGRGTRNTLCSLDDDTYLEIIGPDPDQDEPPTPRPFGVDHVTSPTLVTWCVHVHGISSVVDHWARRGLVFTEPAPMSRRVPGGLLEWSLAYPTIDNPGGIVPFVIDWGNSEHPAAVSARGCALARLSATHPEPEAVARWLHIIGAELDVVEGPQASLHATIEGPGGSIDLPGPQAEWTRH